jgi:hypothetical protein
MAATKTGAALVTSQSCAAATAVNGITGTKDLTTAYGATVTARVTNGGTGPTVACQVNLDISTDNSTWRNFAIATAPTTASAVTDFVFQIPETVNYCRLGFGGNTAQAVTVESYVHTLTAI